MARPALIATLLASIGCAPDAEICSSPYGGALCAPEGTCELPSGGGGTLCYQLGPDNSEGYTQHRCQAQPHDDGVWTPGATCADRGYELLCTDSDGYLIYGDGPTACCELGYPVDGTGTTDCEASTSAS